MTTVRMVLASLVGGIAVLSMGVTWADPAPTPRMTDDQAIQIATDFCQSIGAPVNAPGRATFPVKADETLDPMEPDRFWLPRWSVNFRGQATVEVVDETGIVRKYDNETNRFIVRNAPPAGPEITAEKALQIANDALRATGQPMNELAWSMTIDNRSNIPDDHCWNVQFDRVFNGVVYAGQGAFVEVNYYGGAVGGLNLYFPSPPYVPSIARLNSSQAAQRALEQLAKRGVQNGLVYDEDEKYVVKDHPSPYHLPDTEFVAPRLAWIAHIATGGWPMEEWIDAVDGSILKEATLMADTGFHPVRTRIKTAAQILAEAKEVKVLPRTDKYEWPKTPAVVLSEKSQPRMFEALRASEPSGISHLLVAPELQLLVTTNDARPMTLYYLPGRGLVGDGVAWLTAPDSFNIWIKNFDLIHPPSPVP